MGTQKDYNSVLELGKSTENWNKVLIPLVKKAIFFEILDTLGNARTEDQIRALQERITYTYNDVEYTFKDKETLIKVAGYGSDGLDATITKELNKAIKNLEYRDLVSLFNNSKLVPDASKKDLRLFIGSYKNILETAPKRVGRGSTRSFREGKSFRRYYQLVLGESNAQPLNYFLIGGDREVGDDGVPFDDLDAPLFKQFLTTGADVATYGKPVKESDFGSYLGKIVKNNIEIKVLADFRIKYFQEVLDELAYKLETVESDRRRREARPDAAPEESLAKELPPKPALNPFDFQCFLLENIGALVDLRQAGGKYSPDYKNIIRVNSGDPATVINVIQHGSKPEGVKEFLNICPEVYGMLTPFLKISRMEYDGLGNVKTKDGEPVEKELKIPNFLDPTDVGRILSGDAGRAAGAGIKSFSWSLDGVQPAEVDNNITATLVMYFQSMNDFFQGARSAGQDEPNFLDLIINAERVKNIRKAPGAPVDTPTDNNQEFLDTNITRKAVGNDFRIKVCAGWSVPENLQAVMKNSADADALKGALQNSRVSLFLQQTRHQINFNEDGSVELTVNYQAALAGLLTGKTANILAPSSAIHLQDIERNKEKISDLKGNEFADNKASIKELLEENKLLRKQDKLVKYKKLLKKLFGWTPARARIHGLLVDPKELLLTPFKDLSVEDRQARVKRTQKKGFLEFSTDVSTVMQLDREVTNEIAAMAVGNRLATPPPHAATASQRFDSLINGNEGIPIPFFFLGDLFDSVLEQIKENNKDQALNFKFFISDVDMIDPLQAFKLDNLEDLLDSGLNLADASFLDELRRSNPGLFEDTGVTRLMNIGDIPISVDAFQLWFKNNVIKKDRDKYYFLYFVKDICKDLITKALDSRCFGNELDFTQRFDAVPLTLATKDQNGAQTLLPGGEYAALQLAKAKTDLNCETDSREVSLGIILYSTDSKPRNLTKLYGPDFRRGIYHHYIGSSCGLVKKINFQREDQAFLRETKIQKKGALGAEQLRELYSANLDLVGNNLYKNGMYIYINPSLIDADTPFLDYLGLHGYYFVTSVKSTVTPSGFDTQISALHEGIEFRGQKLLSATSGYGEDTLEERLPVDLPPEALPARAPGMKLTPTQRRNQGLAPAPPPDRAHYNSDDSFNRASGAYRRQNGIDPPLGEGVSFWRRP